MSSKYQGIYRTSSTRLIDWDYCNPGSYFITICTKNHVHWFGKVSDGQMEYSTAGKIVAQELELTPVIRQNVNLVTWVVMPNHVHAIIEIVETPRGVEWTDGSSVETPRRGVSTANSPVDSAHRGVSTNIAWKPGTLGAVINQYKSTCTKRIHAIGITDFAWQSRFYDHIIRNEKEGETIHSYIIGNSDKWAEDEYFRINDTK